MAQLDVVHDVLFSEDDDELAAVVGDRLASALSAGHRAIVIATPDHHRLFADRVVSAGLDPEAALAEGTLLVLDATTTLDLLVPDGEVDRSAFDEVVGRVVREQASHGPVFAFGEMVGLLFDAGRPPEAIELEAAWNELLKETGAGLLCAYRGLLDDPRHSVHIGSLCAMHAGVVAGSVFHRSWPLEGDRAAGSEARRLVANALRTRGVEETAFYETLSVVTELVLNAVEHAGTPLSLDVDIDDNQVSVRVGDGSPHPPVVRESGPRKVKVQRGLKLVAGLSARWGFEPAGAGKVVWAELAR